MIPSESERDVIRPRTANQEGQSRQAGFVAS